MASGWFLCPLCLHSFLLLLVVSSTTAESSTKTASFLPTWQIVCLCLLAVFCAVGIFTLLVAFLVRRCKRISRKSSSASNLLELAPPTLRQFPPSSSIEDNSSISFCAKTGEDDQPLEGGQTEMINCRNLAVLPFTSAAVIKELEKHMKDAESLSVDIKGPAPLDTPTYLATPTIKRVCTYMASDDVTIIDEASPPRRRFLRKLRPARSPLDERAVLVAMLRHGPRQFHFTRPQLRGLLARGAAAFGAEPSLLEVPLPCQVYGDIHGQYCDLLRWLNLRGFPDKIRCVFLGDFVDRGPHGIEVVVFITCLKLIWPSSVFVCRGNHEEECLNRAYSFFDEVAARFPQDATEAAGLCSIYACFAALFVQLPLAVLIGGRILGMHGGISPQLGSLQDILDIRRPIFDFQVGTLACDLVWSDPDPLCRELRYRPNLDREPRDGIGQLFTADAVRETCERLGVQLIIRGHQAPRQGYNLFADHRLLTLFSAPGYKGLTPETINLGASLHIDEDFEIVIYQIQVSERYRQLRIDDLKRRKELAAAAQQKAASDRAASDGSRHD